MGELRRDPIVGRWVIVDTDSPLRPEDFDKETHHWKESDCPFCYSNESLTPPEIEAIRMEQTLPNSPGWKVRVVPNKFPALMVEGDLNRRGVGIYDMSCGVGAHEVIIETPYHYKDLPDLLDEEVKDILEMYLRRALDLKKDRRFKYILIFKNYGSSAGASLEHPHTQLIALPMVPKNVLEELKGAYTYFEYRDRCIFCDMIRQELQEKERIVLEDKNFLVICPFVSRFPFEVWILPKEHNPDFFILRAEKFSQLAKILKEVLRKIKALLSHPAYNYIIHTSPLDGAEYESYHWHIEIIPKLTRTAGFEWGTGFYLVPTPPEIATRYLKEV